MSKLIVWIVLMGLGPLSFAQLSSKDIRHASGKGPYPIYVSFQATSASNRSLFRDFIRAAGQKGSLHLQGFEGNLGVSLNDDNFLWVPGWKIRRLSLEAGYRTLRRRLPHNQYGPNTLDLRLHDRVISVRLGIRGNILYPITYQLQAGPVLRHESSIRSLRLESGVVKEDIMYNVRGQHTFFKGLDLRARLMLFDPAGTAGGLGVYFESRYLWSFGKRRLDPFYASVLDQASQEDLKSWSYVSWSVGVIAPLALRLVGF